MEAGVKVAKAEKNILDDIRLNPKC